MRQRTYIGRIAFGKFRGKNLIFYIKVKNEKFFYEKSEMG